MATAVGVAEAGTAARPRPLLPSGRTDSVDAGATGHGNSNSSSSSSTAGGDGGGGGGGGSTVHRLTLDRLDRTGLFRTGWGSLRSGWAAATSTATGEGDGGDARDGGTEGARETEGGARGDVELVETRKGAEGHHGAEPALGGQAGDSSEPRFGGLARKRQGSGLFVRAAEIEPDIPWYIIYPGSRTFRTKQVLGNILVCYVALVVPFSVAFTDDVERERLAFWICSLIVDMGFLLDLVTEFFTAFRDHSGQVVADLDKIAIRYVRRTFVFDLVASFPFSLLSATSVGEAARVGRLARLPRLLRLLKIAKMYSVFMDTGSVSALMAGLQGLVNFALVLFLLVHWLACVWHILGVETGRVGTSWLRDQNLYHSIWSDRYTASVYWVITTLSTVGYGDIVPTNRGEHCFVIILMAVGATGYAVGIGQISSFLAGLSLERRHRVHVQNALSSFFFKHTLPLDLRRRISAAIDNSVALTQAPDRYDALLSALPPQLRIDVLALVHERTIVAVPFLREHYEAHTNFVVEVARLLSAPVVFQAHELIAVEGSYSAELYFLAEGSVVLCKSGVRALELIAELGAHHVGTLGVLYSVPREYTVVAGEDGCTVYALPAEHARAFARDFPLSLSTMRKEAEEHAQDVMQAVSDAMVAAAEEGADSDIEAPQQETE